MQQKSTGGLERLKTEKPEDKERIFLISVWRTLDSLNHDSFFFKKHFPRCCSLKFVREIRLHCGKRTDFEVLNAPLIIHFSVSEPFCVA